MKKKFILLLIVFLLCSCSKKTTKEEKIKKEETYDMYAMPEEVQIDLNENVFNVFETHLSDELINNANVEILSSDELINDEIGEHTYTLLYQYDNKKYKYDITYNIVDTTAPIFISAPGFFNAQVNEFEDMCHRIAYGDNYDAYPTCTVEGEYSFNNLGTYYLEFVIKDSSNNENRKAFTLNILEELPKPQPSYSTPNYVYMDELLPYKNENTSIGIDISKWQGNIDFNKVKEAGIEFVIMRIGVQIGPNDEYGMDSKYQEYIKGAKEAGLKISVYVFANASSEENGRNAALWVIDALDGEKLDLPIAYDWEDWGDFNSYGMSLHTLSASYLAFEKTLNEHGYNAMLYSSKYYLENVWTNYENTNIWLAHYVPETTYKGEFMLWQITSEAKIDGINDNTVDIDILYKGKEKVLEN